VRHMSQIITQTNEMASNFLYFVTPFQAHPVQIFVNIVQMIKRSYSPSVIFT
jgi:hypothetical protein